MILDLTRCILVAQATDSAASVEAAEQSPFGSEVTPTLQPGHRSGAQRRVAMTKSFTQLREAIQSEESAQPAPSAEPGPAAGVPQPEPPLSPRSQADKESRERTRVLSARLMNLSKRSTALAKAAKAHGLVSTSEVPAASLNSPSAAAVDAFVAVSLRPLRECSADSMLTRLRVAWAQGGAANAAKQRMAQSFTKHGVVPVTSPAAPAFAAPTLSLSPAVNSPALALGASMLTAHHFDDAVRFKPSLY